LSAESVARLGDAAPRLGRTNLKGKTNMSQLWELLESMWSDDSAQDIAEYAVMLAVILVIVVGTIKIIGGKSNNIFSTVASSIE
jgi:Flp pilus assembly pilin Flp